VFFQSLRPLVSAALVAISVSLASAAPLVQSESKPTELEGVWHGQKAAEQGRSRDLKPGLTRLTFRGDVMLAVGFVGRPAEEKKLAIRVNPKASPKTLDIIESPSQTREALYELVGDELRIALSLASTSRPQSFATHEGSGTIVLTLKRSGMNF
jgi:uncharacterized protein (TIGR03067 family)